MFILGALVLYFLLCLYCMILKLYALIFIISGILFIAVRKTLKKMLTFFLCIPIIALISLSLYYQEKIPNDVTVTKIYQDKLLVQDGLRLFWLEYEDERVVVGDRLIGELHYVGEGNVEQGVIYTVQGEQLKVYTDFIGRFRALKEKLTKVLVNRHGEHYGGLMASLVLGDQTYMNEERSKNMNELG